MEQTTKKTTHKADCQMAFGRKDATCPRCQELLAGAKPRASWTPQWKRDGLRNADALRAERVRNLYCFCPDTSLAAFRCDKCGKRPYTD